MSLFWAQGRLSGGGGSRCTPSLLPNRYLHLLGGQRLLQGHPSGFKHQGLKLSFHLSSRITEEKGRELASFERFLGVGLAVKGHTEE